MTNGVRTGPAPDPTADAGAVRPVLLSAYDTAGGAARAAYRLHTGLRRVGVDSRMVVQYQYSSDSAVIRNRVPGMRRIWRGARRILDSLPKRCYPRRIPALFSAEWVPVLTTGYAHSLHPDVAHLHWVQSGLLTVQAVARLSAPIVWTIHDMWPLTGGCHYSAECDRYTVGCHSCPALGSHARLDLARVTWLRKMRAWQDLPITVASPSNWLADCARRSVLFRDRPITVIPYGLDLDLYRPLDKAQSRLRFGLPLDASIILFRAVNATTDPRKGFDLLCQALRALPPTLPSTPIEAVVFGGADSGIPTGLPIPIRNLGPVADEAELAALYQAADLFVHPAREDNLPNTVLEAMACGAPCVGFDVGGLSDMIEQGRTGYLARALDPHDLAEGMVWVLADDARRRRLSAEARQKAEANWSDVDVARRYLELYDSVMRSSRSRQVLAIAITADGARRR